MAKSLAQLRSQLQQELRDPNDKIWNSTSKNRFINRAYLQVQKDNNFEWRENKESTTLSSPYTIPSDFVIMETVFDGTNELDVADKIRLKKQNKDLTTTGEPRWYYYEGTTLALYPVSTTDIDIDYKKQLAALSGDSDTIDFPDAFAEAIVAYARYLAWSSPRGNRQEAEGALQDYGNELAMLMGSFGLQDEGYQYFGIQRTSYIPRDNVL